MKSLFAALLTAGCLLSFAADAGKERPDRSRHKPHRPGGFIINPAPPPARFDSRIGEHLCRFAGQALKELNCPPTFHPPDSAGGPGTSAIMAELPHFRLTIILKRMENEIVSGGGIKQPEDIGDAVFAFWKITSTAATDSLPPVDGNAYNLPAPDAGQTIGNIDHNNALFQGVITNGCMPTVKTFDLELESFVGAFDEDTLGAVNLEDEVPAPGFYTFRYFIQATGPDGGVSRFLFSGDAIAWCSSDGTL